MDKRTYVGQGDKKGQFMSKNDLTINVGDKVIARLHRLHEAHNERNETNVSFDFFICYIFAMYITEE